MIESSSIEKSENSPNVDGTSILEFHIFVKIAVFTEFLTKCDFWKNHILDFVCPHSVLFKNTQYTQILSEFVSGVWRRNDSDACSLRYDDIVHPGICVFLFFHSDYESKNGDFDWPWHAVNHYIIVIPIGSWQERLQVQGFVCESFLVAWEKGTMSLRLHRSVILY